jgi:hypothetical protein
VPSAKGSGAANDATVSTDGATRTGPDPDSADFAAEEVKRLKAKLRQQEDHVKATEKALADAERRAKRG